MHERLPDRDRDRTLEQPATNAALVENIVQDALDSAVAVEPSSVEEVIYISYEETKEDEEDEETHEVNGDKIVEVQLPDGRRVRLQVPQDQDPEAFAADFVSTVEDES